MSDLLALDEINDKIYVHSGITATIRNSFAAPAVNGKGIMMETSGGNLVTVDVVTAKLYTHSGISATISSSFTVNWGSQKVYALTIDESGNLISCNYTGTGSSNLVFVHSGISATITTSFAAVSSYRDVATDTAGGC